MRIMSKVIVCILLLFQFVLACLSEERLWIDRQVGGIIRRVVIIRPEEFSLANIERLSKQFLDSRKGKFQLLTFHLFTEGENARLYLIGHGGTDYGYEDWLHTFNRYGQKAYPMAELLAYGDSATLRYRERTGKIGQTRFYGRDTFSFAVGHDQFEVVAVGFSDIPDVYKDGPHDPVSIGFSIMTRSRLNKEVAQKVLKWLSTDIKSRDLGVGLRNDAWFLENSGPLVSPFFKLERPPSKEEYRASLTVGCRFWGGKLSCSEQGGFGVQAKIRDDRK